ncbi:MAG: carbohydrate binding module family protein, partial [Phycisphaerales bacterium]|nr:carbohydrate binding module family protein [Phycisphaerales bacterium]
DGRPVYRVWSAAPAFLSNVAGNGSKLLRYLREQCRKEFGFNPYIMVPEEWIKLDPSSAGPAVVDAVVPWFTPVPGPNYSDWNVHTWHGVTVGACIPQFRISEDADPNAPTWIVDPQHGNTLARGLAATAKNGHCVATFIEGFDDYWENATLWRARNIDPAGNPLGYKETGYDYPNQRINIVRRYSRHQFPPDLRLEAESCDTFSGAAPQAPGVNRYRNGDLAVEETKNAEGGYDVFNGQAGETLTWYEVPIKGTVHLQVRVATPTADGKMHFVIDGRAQKPFVVPGTPDAQKWITVEAGAFTSARETDHTVALVMDTAGVSVDWWQLQP